MKCASIDIGTNTLRLLVAELTEQGTLESKFQRRFITRLGGGFTATKGIDEAGAEKAFSALDEIRAILETKAPQVVDAVATSVVRSAVNTKWFVREACERLKAEIRVIDGIEEARLTLLGVSSVLKSGDYAGRKRLVMDIGGGSSEFIFADGDAVMAAISLELGVVHLTEKYLRNDPPGEAELKELRAEIDGAIKELKEKVCEQSVDLSEYSPGDNGALFIGTAGTVTTLSALNLALGEYDPDIINGSVLTGIEVEGLFDRLKGLTMKERLHYVALEKGREDLIIAGALIVVMVMSAFGFKEMVVSDAGLLEGIMLDSVSQKTKKIKGGDGVEY